MTIDETERRQKSLVKLNRQIAEYEDQGSAVRKFFEKYLSEQLIFRHASGKVVGKGEFLEGLKNNSFLSRVPEQIEATLQGDRALVTLIVVGTENNGVVHSYRNIRLFTRSTDQWLLEFWYNYEITGL